MKNLLFFATLLGLLLTSCADDAVTVNDDLVDLRDHVVASIESFDFDLVDPELSEEIALQLYDHLSSDYFVDRSLFAEIGSPAQPEVQAAILVVLDASKAEYLATTGEFHEEEALDAEELDLEARGYTRWRWTGGAAKSVWWWKEYPCERIANFNGGCSGTSYSTRVRYRKCRNIDCSVPSACR